MIASTFRKLGWFSSLLLMSALAAVPAWAQEAAAEAAAEEGGHKSVWELFQATGIVGWLLLITFSVGLALVIEHVVNLREDKLAPPDIVNEIETLIDEGDYDEALEVCKADDSYFAKVAAAGLLVRGAGKEEVMTAVDQASGAEAFRLNTKISYLSLVGNIGPLLGLLGTVTGMITSFQKIETMKAPTPADLAVGVYESLVNTTMGLFIAIVFLTAYFVFKNKVTAMTLKFNVAVAEILKRLKHVEETEAVVEQAS